MPLDIAAIRARYPYPISKDDVELHGLEAYCVGGAICLASGLPYILLLDDRFPGESVLARVLCDLNPALNTPPDQDIEHTLAYVFALQITGHNDRRQFDEAWEAARTAFVYQPPCEGGTP